MTTTTGTNTTRMCSRRPATVPTRLSIAPGSSAEIGLVSLTTSATERHTYQVARVTMIAG
jgi:hypothetical protein